MRKNSFFCFDVITVLFQGLTELIEQFKNLTEKNRTQGANEVANERLNNIKTEAENMAKDIEDKLNQIEGMAEWIMMYFNSDMSRDYMMLVFYVKAIALDT